MGDVASIFKLYGAFLTRDSVDLQCRLMGTRGYGWQGNDFTETELEWTRNFLGYRANTIYGGTSEVQRNIIAKRVLRLPD